MNVCGDLPRKLYSGKLLRKKLLGIDEKKNFGEKTLMDGLFVPPQDAKPPNFVKKKNLL